jgi:hypothetical protein
MNQDIDIIPDHLTMTLHDRELDMEFRDFRNGAPILECVVIGLVILEMVAVTVAAAWLWNY